MKIRTVIVIGATAIGPVLGLASPTAAAPPEYPHGVGVCISQIAVDPSLAGVSRLGEAISAAAGPSQSGSDVPTLLDSARGDGPSGCGAPPGPHRSGA